MGDGCVMERASLSGESSVESTMLMMFDVWQLNCEAHRSEPNSETRGHPPSRMQVQQMAQIPYRYFDQRLYDIFIV
jgi:hypothetical protein